ncbi:MAG: class I SAM-dependent methyltransferase [Nitrospinae bacterium]|nr:class I SAM-dependent methyltransferase [Nitrospinota bacterium]MBF0634416.1 class I SAM-dependent methyltransferase [Nitrospinota bacterium]
MKAEQYDAHAAVRLTHWWRYGTNTFFARLVGDNVEPGAMVLDHGCGVGDLITLLKEKYRVVGVDAFPAAVRYARDANPDSQVTQGDIMALPFADATFDAVVSLDVLYHANVTDDTMALAEIERILKPGGRVFLQLPAYEWLRSGHDAVAMTRKRYNAEEVRSSLEKSGFTPVRTGYRMTFFFFAAALARLLKRGQAHEEESASSDMKNENPALNTLLKKVISVENAVARYINFPFGLSVVAVAKKAEPKKA